MRTMEDIQREAERDFIIHGRAEFIRRYAALVWRLEDAEQFEREANEQAYRESVAWMEAFDERNEGKQARKELSKVELEHVHQ